MRDAKRLFLKTIWKVNGVINFGSEFDTKSARYAYNRALKRDEDGNITELGIGVSKNSNTKYSKVNIYTTKDGKLVIKVKCSGGKIRTFIFGPNSNGNVIPDLDAYVLVRSTINNILRGYMDTYGTTVNRKSCVAVTDGEAIADPVLIDGTRLRSLEPVLNMETHNSTGERTNTSLFEVENAGEYYIESEINVDLTQLAWFSMSDVRGMRQIPHELEYQMAAEICKNVNQADSSIHQYILKNGTSIVPESGLLLDNTGIETCLNQLLHWIKNGYCSCAATNTIKFVGFSEAKVVTENGEYDIDPTEGVVVESVDLEYKRVASDQENLESDYLAAVKKLKDDAKKKKDDKKNEDKKNGKKNKKQDD